MDVGWGGAVVAVIIAAGVFVAARLNNGAILQQRVNELTTEVFKSKDEILSLKDEQHQCIRENAELKENIKALIYRIGHLEQGTGLGPGEPRSGIIVADLKGRIRVFSPSLTPLLRWLPEEVNRKPVTILIPPDLLPKHSLMFKHFVENETHQLDSSRVLLTEALTKLGERVKVAITLDGWQVGSEGLITATIREIKKDYPTEDVKLVVEMGKSTSQQT